MAAPTKNMILMEFGQMIFRNNNNKLHKYPFPLAEAN